MRMCRHKNSMQSTVMAKYGLARCVDYNMILLPALQPSDVNPVSAMGDLCHHVVVNLKVLVLKGLM